MTNMVSNCSDSCGWFIGALAALSFGSFGVPIKHVKRSKLVIDPFVMQTYKSIVCFATCWFVVFLGVEVKFTPWGIIGGLFWVPGATCGIYGIQNAGLAIAVGTWSSLIVISSFAWGIFVFQERVKSVYGACCGALILIVGLVGMSIYSSPSSSSSSSSCSTAIIGNSSSSNTNTRKGRAPLLSILDEEKELEMPLLGGGGGGGDCGNDTPYDICTKPIIAKRRAAVVHNAPQHDLPPPAPQSILANEEGGCYNHNSRNNNNNNNNNNTNNNNNNNNKSELLIWEYKENEDGDHHSGMGKGTDVIRITKNLVLTRWQAGILGAVINGTWGGSSMIPMHFARDAGFFGANYLISYSCGAMLVTIVMWILRYTYHLCQTGGNTKKAYDNLPSFHLREMWFSGFLSGLLYSLGNFCSIITVSVLGQGVGYSFVQTSMLVSGLWGILFFGEVKGIKRIIRWIASSIITIIGILWLSYEHESSSAH